MTHFWQPKIGRTFRQFLTGLEKAEYHLTVCSWNCVVSYIFYGMIIFAAYSTNSALSERLEDHSNLQNEKISNHARLLGDLDQSHQRTAGRVEHVATQVGRLKVMKIICIKRLELQICTYPIPE